MLLTVGKCFLWFESQLLTKWVNQNLVVKQPSKNHSSNGVDLVVITSGMFCYLRPLYFVKRCNYIRWIKCHTEASFLFMSVVLLPAMFCILYWCPINTSTKKKSRPNKVTVADVQAARGGTLGKCSDGTAPIKVWRWSHGTEMYGYLTVGFSRS